MIPLKYIRNFWIKLEMLLINYEISIQLELSKNYILVVGTVANQNPEFQINDKKLYVPVVNMSFKINSFRFFERNS